MAVTNESVLRRGNPFWREMTGLFGREPAKTGTIVVSPHFDDAVLSCWSVLGGDVTVLTVFSEGPDDDRVAWWDKDAGVTSRERMRQRSAENDVALTLAGAQAASLGLREEMYDGRRVRRRDLRRPLEQAARVYVCAGIGLEQVKKDHVLVRNACLAVRPDSILYADNPYCHFRAELELPIALAARYQRRVVALDEEERERKAEAIRCYRGEIEKLERVYGPFAVAEELPFEVFWEPVRGA